LNLDRCPLGLGSRPHPSLRKEGEEGGFFLGPERLCLFSQSGDHSFPFFLGFGAEIALAASPCFNLFSRIACPYIPFPTRRRLTACSIISFSCTAIACGCSLCFIEHHDEFFTSNTRLLLSFGEVCNDILVWFSLFPLLL